MSLHLGIDPGKKGALAVIDSEAMTIECIDMPDTTAGLHEFIAALPLIKKCTIEKPFYPQMIGTANCAKIAQAYGILIGAIMWRDIPMVEVTPRKWKAGMNLSTSKTASREMAQQMFPDNADMFKRVKDDGRAEAVLIAYWGAQK